MRNLVIAFASLLTAFGGLHAAKTSSMQKVLILELVNKDGNPSYQYLQKSITDSVRAELKKQFVFAETPRNQWQEVARKNFIYEGDYHTPTASMNLGLLAKQDVVISGGYSIRKAAPAAGKTESPAVIVTGVRIYDISKKKIAADFTEEGPADSRIFDSIKAISNRIVKESKVILPSKEEWKRTGLRAPKASQPIFADWMLGMRAAYGAYTGGVGDRVKPQPPQLLIIGRANLPFISEKIAMQLEVGYMKDTVVADKNPAIERLQPSMNNYIFGGYAFMDFPLWRKVYFHPHVGGGMVQQVNSTSGAISSQVTGTLPFFGGGVEISREFRSVVRGIIYFRTVAEFEDPETTLLHTVGLGVNFRL